MHGNNLKASFQQRIKQLSPKQKQSLAKLLSITPDKAKLVACVTMLNDQAIDSKELKTFAQSALPEHFVPQVWKQVQGIPRTSNRKINRQNAQDYAWQELAKIEDDDGFDIFGDDIFGTSAYVAPTNETEALLAKIWSDVLAVGDISIHDEFIEVGGDSLLSIRILARINKAGLSIATEDFFEFPTIAGQAKAISKASENSYEQGSTKGTFALIPIQHWLFERVQIDPQHWNQSILLAVDEKLDFQSLERAFQKLLFQHDALRIAFEQNDALQWQQKYLPLDTQLAVDYIDIAQHSEPKQNEFIEQHCNLLNQSMNLSKGNLARMAFFKTQTGVPNKLVITIHHLVIDAESWRILLEDLQAFWTSFADGATPALPRKTTSFKYWSEKLVDYAQSKTLNSELAYWLKQTSQVKNPVDFEVFPNDLHQNTEGSGHVISTFLDKDKTAFLLNEMPKRFKIEVKDTLISALVLVIQKWSNNNEVLIDIEGHGREDLYDNIDISRTIGWFTSVFPVLFCIKPESQPIDTLLSVSNTLKAIPKKGIGHGLLREIKLNETLKQQTHSELCFNYLGRVDTHDSDTQTDLIKTLATKIGQTRSSACLRAFHLEVNAKVENGQLHVDWSYSQHIHKADTIETLASEFIQALTTLLALDTPLAIEDNEEDLFDLLDLEDDELDAIAKALSGDN